MAADAPVPNKSDVSINNCLKRSLPIPLLLNERQSINWKYPLDNACDAWYITPCALALSTPLIAARLASPLTAVTEVSRSTPAAVNLPILSVI